MTQFKTIERPASVSAAIKNYRAECVTIKGEAEFNYRGCHIVGRGVEIIALDETGERNDALGGPDYISAKELTVKELRNFVTHALKCSPGPNNPHTLAAIHIAGGFDIHDSFADYMEHCKHGCGDYDIYEEWAGQDIPLDMLT